MINVVYLVLVFAGQNGLYSGTSVLIPQANMAQCEVNSKNHIKDSVVKRSYCIVGVK